MEEIIGRGVPIYHVAAEYRVGPFSRRFDFHPTNGNRMRKIIKRGDSKLIPLGKSKKNMAQVISFENTLDKRYFLAFNDCRHYTKQLVEFSLEQTANNLLNPVELHKMFKEA